jgi:hypothetical protein
MVDKPLATRIDEVLKEVKQARKRLDDLEKRLIISFEEFLERLPKKK